MRCRTLARFAHRRLSPKWGFTCKTQVESARQENDEYDVAGLNKGIVYMMTIPYLLMGSVGYFWYRRTHPKAAKK